MVAQKMLISWNCDSEGDDDGVDLREGTDSKGMLSTAVVNTMSGRLMGTTSLIHLEIQSVDALMEFSEI